MLLDEGMDTGPTLAQREVTIGSQETAGELEGRLAHEGADLLVETLPEYLTGRLQPCPQPEEGVTVVHRLKKEDAHIDWGRPAASLACQIRAFSPQVGAYTFWDGRRLKIFLAQPLEGADVPAARPGTVFEWQGCPAVVTGEGALVLLQLQMAGKRPMKGEVFMRGYRAMVGDELGPREAG
jgi:methionyl-tRNA formyltransferase